MNMICPLCNKECDPLPMDGWALFFCPTKAKLMNEKSLSHFACYTNSTIMDGMYNVYSATIVPYRLENHMKADKPYSRILVMDGRTYIDMDGYEMYEFDEIIRLDEVIHMDSEDKLLERLKLLVLLS
jgi:hypothetical protein